MRSMRPVVGVLAASALLTGCATMGGRAKESEQAALKTRVETLEREVAVLNERVKQPSSQPTQVYATASVSPNSAGNASTGKRLTVRQVQLALTAAGHYKGPVDGKEGPQTKQAVRHFQKDKGLKADGVVGRETSEAMAAYLPESEKR